jgi:hypothetical protein
MAKTFPFSQKKETLDVIVANRRKVKELTTDTEKKFQNLDKMIRKQPDKYKNYNR